MFEACKIMLKVLGWNNTFTSFVHEHVGEIRRWKANTEDDDTAIPAAPLQFKSKVWKCVEFHNLSDEAKPNMSKAVGKHNHGEVKYCALAISQWYEVAASMGAQTVNTMNST